MARSDVAGREARREGSSEQEPPLGLTLLEAQSEASLDGILVVSPEGRVLSFNRRFVDLWELSEDVLAGRSDEAVLAALREKLVEPEEFLTRVAYLYAHPDERGRDEIRLLDGRVLDRHSAPVTDEAGRYYGRAWFFRDVTEEKRAEAELRQRIGGLDALAGMAELLVRAETLEEILDHALDTLTSALALERAAVLLLDADGVMQLRAWRGLSEAYRRVAGGHSPWSRDAVEPGPLVVDDVAEDAGLEELRPAIAAEGIRSLAFVPLVHQRRLLGEVLLCSGEPAAFGPRELRIAETVASQISAAAARARAQTDLRESRDQLAVILREVADGITVQDPAGRIAFANEAAARQIGFSSAAELLSTPVAQIMARFEVLDEARRPLALNALPGRRALQGESSERTICYRVVATGEERWSIVRATPVLGEDGRVEFAVNVFHDITERKRAEDRSAFLAEASKLLSSSLDYAATLAKIPWLAVPTLADWSVVDVLEPDGSLRRVGMAHVDPERLELLAGAAPPRGYRRVVASGEPLLLEQISEPALREAARDAEHLAVLRILRPHALICVPLVSRGRTLGAITLASTRSGLPYGKDELALAQELASRAALAVDNALLYREAQEAAERLEQSFALLDALLASAPIGIGFWDRELRYVRVNETLAALNGLPADEHVGRTLAEVVPRLAPDLERLYRQVLETGEPYEHVESTGADSTQPGSERHWLSSYYPVKTEAGVAIGVGALITEVTERRRAETERGLLLEAEQRARRDAERAADTLRKLERVTDATLAHMSLDQLLQELLERIAELVEADTAAVLLLDREGNELVASAAKGLEEEVERGVRIPIGRGFAGRVAAERRPLAIEDVDHADILNPLLRERGIKSLLGVPLRIENRVIGVLHVGTLVRRTFGDDDRRLLQLVGDRVALALEQARLYDSERAARAAAETAERRVGFLAEASRILSASLDYETTLQNVADLAGTTIADWMNVYLVEGDGAPTRIVSRHRDPAKDAFARRLVERYPPRFGGDNPQTRVLRTGRPLLIEELTDEMLVQTAQDDEHLAAMRSLDLSSAIIVPVAAPAKTLGTITFALEGGRRYDSDDLSLAEELGRRIGLAVENARLYQTGRELLVREREARREAEARAQAAQALEFVGDGVLLLDRAGVVRLWNPAAQEMTGLAAPDVVGREAGGVIPGWDELRPRVPTAPAGARASARPETLPLDVSGKEVWLSISAVEFDAGTVYAFRDVTEERAVEKLKSDFVSTVSHELRTPLAAIYGAALTLRREDLPLAPEQQANLLGVIADEAERLARIVNDILWTSRIESDSLQITIQSCDPIELARTVVESALVHAPDDVAITVRADDVMPVAADPDKVRQALGNLVENAVKYSPAGGPVEVQVDTGGGVVRFRVRDEGLGIPPSEHERVFEKFYRLDPDLTQGVGGTGLGLYICRELVRRMGGRVWVESEPGHGSTFAFELPAAAADVVGHAR